MITVTNLHKRFGSQTVLRDVSLSFKKGTMTAIVGPSGTGKSVLLKIITGLLAADGGSVIVDGKAVSELKSMQERLLLRSKMGVLFQFAALFDSQTVFDNVAFPLRHGPSRQSEAVITHRCLEALENVGMRGYECAFPGEISIGMRKRVGIARALVTHPEVILFDEPNTGLDPEMGQEIYDLIKETQEKFAITGIVISHEIPEVFQVCSHVAMLYDGMVHFVGDVERFKESPNPVVQQFIHGAIEGPIQIN